MLMKVDKLFGHKLSFLINILTFGREGSSLCGRLHLNGRYKHKKTGCPWPEEFRSYLV